MVVDVSEIDELPEPWGRLLRDAQIKSQNELASKASISTATVNRLIHEGRTSLATVKAVADCLTDGDTDPIWAATGQSTRDYGPFPIDRISDDLELLTPKQRKALIATIRSMASPEGNQSSSAPERSKPADLDSKRKRMIQDATTEDRAARKESAAQRDQDDGSIEPT